MFICMPIKMYFGTEWRHANTEHRLVKVVFSHSHEVKGKLRFAPKCSIDAVRELPVRYAVCT